MKRYVMHLGEILGMNSLMRRFHRQDIAILMYHGVVPDNAPFDAWTQVRQSRFVGQMEYVKRHYEVVGLDALEETSGSEGEQTRPRVLITFDDGYRNNYTVAFPVLEHFGFPAIIFLATGFIGSRDLYWFDRVISAVQCSGCTSIDLRAVELMEYHFPPEKGVRRWDAVQEMLTGLKTLEPRSRDEAVDRILRTCGEIPLIAEHLAVLDSDEIREMAKTGLVEFGSHTHGHEILTQLPRDEVRKTINASLEIIEGITGKAVLCFAYPNGDYNGEVMQVLQDMGVRYAFSTGFGFWSPGCHRLKIPRIGVGGYDADHVYATALSGLRDVISQFK